MDSPQAGARTHSDGEPRQPAEFNRRHLLFGGIAAAVTVGYAYSSTQSDAGSSVEPTAAQGPTTVTEPSVSVESSTTAPTTTAPTTTAPDPEPTPVPPLSQTLSEGMVGAEVQAVQQRLADLNFDPGPVDGIFGPATIRSVWAFEKIVLLTPRTEMQGLVTQAVWETMNANVQIRPRRLPGGTHMEVYLPEQVSVLFENGEAAVISHVSSGENVEWCDVVEIDLDDGATEEKGICGISKTPGGVYHFERKVDGWRNAKLGRLYQPVYFNYGIAIHGAGNVPDHPASRGCVRHPMHIAEYLPDLIEIDDMIYVFDGVEEPETYGAAPMIFDYPDPDWIPPETTSTTSTTTTTLPPPVPATTRPSASTAPTSTTSSPTTTTQ